MTRVATAAGSKSFNVPAFHILVPVDVEAKAAQFVVGLGFSRHGFRRQRIGRRRSLVMTAALVLLGPTAVATKLGIPLQGFPPVHHDFGSRLGAGRGKERSNHLGPIFARVLIVFRGQPNFGLILDPTHLFAIHATNRGGKVDINEFFVFRFRFAVGLGGFGSCRIARGLGGGVVCRSARFFLGLLRCRRCRCCCSFNQGRLLNGADRQGDKVDIPRRGIFFAHAISLGFRRGSIFHQGGNPNGNAPILRRILGGRVGDGRGSNAIFAVIVIIVATISSPHHHNGLIRIDRRLFLGPTAGPGRFPGRFASLFFLSVTLLTFALFATIIFQSILLVGVVKTLNGTRTTALLLGGSFFGQDTVVVQR
mmetsp:Transcript_4464/g.12398  ORF Transcript_4464/g.12398 Transcript_4464/m.12398 type:complete len:365 (+) Transcript_4464:1781-2875(+)